MLFLFEYLYKQRKSALMTYAHACTYTYFSNLDIEYYSV